MRMKTFWWRYTILQVVVRFDCLTSKQLYTNARKPFITPEHEIALYGLATEWERNSDKKHFETRYWAYADLISASDALTLTTSESHQRQRIFAKPYPSIVTSLYFTCIIQCNIILNLIASM